MKRAGKILFLLVALVLMAGMLCGCWPTKNKIEELGRDGFYLAALHNGGGYGFHGSLQEEYSAEKNREFVELLGRINKKYGLTEASDEITKKAGTGWALGLGITGGGRTCHITIPGLLNNNAETYDIQIVKNNYVQIRKDYDTKGDLIKGIENSFCSIYKDQNKSQITIGNFIDDDGKAYRMDFRRDGERLVMPELDGTVVTPDPDPDPTPSYTNYKLTKFTVAGIEINPDSMTPEQHATYDMVLTLYGKTLKLSSDKVEFAAGSTFSGYSPAAYTKSGNNITFTNTNLASLASGTMSGTTFKLIIVGSYVFEYVPA